jgi:GH24 family phage-related lysozyme (muramidase)
MSSEHNAARQHAEFEALLAYREAQEVAMDAAPEAPAPARMFAFGAAAATRGISRRATDLIVAYETGGKDYYERHFRSRPVWPKASSGITIGCGYDLGYVSPRAFEADWAELLRTLTAAQRAALTSCIGFHSGKHSEAQMRALLAKVQEMKVPWETALSVFSQRTLPLYIFKTAAALPNTEKLSDDSFGALVSLTFNRGASYSRARNWAKDRLDRYREMRAIKSLMAQEKFAGIPDQIRAMVRIWTGTAIELGMRRRRMDEAKLFADGLTV